MRIRSYLVASLGVALLLASGGLGAQTVLRASHQWPGGIADLRDEFIQMIARDVAAADVGLEIRVYPGEALYKARDQWPAMVRGRLDMTVLPLDYMSGRHPQFSATLMPGLVKDHDHARRLNDSPFMAEIKRIMDEVGIIALADGWVSGGLASSEHCILAPEDIAGQVTRAAGPAFERMLAGAGASIASMPSSEIYTAMQTGVLDAANTSSASFMSFRLHEQAVCYTGPGDSALWFMYEPILMSKRSWERLDAAQQAALGAAAERAEAYFASEVRKQDQQAEEMFEAEGVEVVHMSPEQIAAWLEIAERTSYSFFAEEVEGGQALLDSARAVD